MANVTKVFFLFALSNFNTTNQFINVIYPTESTKNIGKCMKKQCVFCKTYNKTHFNCNKCHKSYQLGLQWYEHIKKNNCVLTTRESNEFIDHFQHWYHEENIESKAVYYKLKINSNQQKLKIIKKWQECVPVYEVNLPLKPYLPYICPYCKQRTIKNIRREFITQPLLHSVPHFIVNTIYQCTHSYCKSNKTFTCWDNEFININLPKLKLNSTKIKKTSDNAFEDDDLNEMSKLENNKFHAIRIGNKGHWYITFTTLQILLEKFINSRSITITSQDIKGRWVDFLLNQSKEYLTNPTEKCMSLYIYNIIVNNC